jgi:hypothetical protein
MEGISVPPDRTPLQLHVECFHLWERVRRGMFDETAPRIRAADGGFDGR